MVESDAGCSRGDARTMTEHDNQRKSPADPTVDFSHEAFYRSLLESNEAFATLLSDLALDQPVLAGTDGAPTISDALSDQVEIRFRDRTTKLIDSVLDEQETASESQASPAMSALGAFWSATVELCLHWVTCHRFYDQKLVAGATKKLPFTLLDDVLDGLPIADAQTFWCLYLSPALPSLLRLESTSNLIFLKTCNAFWKRCCLHGTAVGADGGRWASLALQTLSESFPLGERSATRVWGTRNLDSLPEFETAESYEQHAQQPQDTLSLASTGGISSTASDKQGTVDYNIYQSLWSLHHDFSSPFIKNVGVFLTRVKNVLQVLEVTPVVESEKNMSPLEPSEGQVSGQYLTHARLLPYQLQDPLFRAHFLAQFLIVAHHLTNEAPAVGSQLEESRNLAASLLRACEPHLFEALSQVLTSSEQYWTHWKKKKCPELDVKQNERIASDRPAPKRPRLDDGDIATSQGSTEFTSIIPPLLDLNADLPKICQSLRAPQLELHLGEYDYLDALDPESGIEAEYNPKFNPFFCWQALRLLPVRDFDKIQFTNGDFESAIRHIWSRDKAVVIPGDDSSLLPVPDFEVQEPAPKAMETEHGGQMEEAKFSTDPPAVDEPDNAPESDDPEMCGGRQSDGENDQEEDVQISEVTQAKRYNGSTDEVNDNRENGLEKVDEPPSVVPPDNEISSERRGASDDAMNDEESDKSKSVKVDPSMNEVPRMQAHPASAKNTPASAREQSPPRTTFSSNRSSSLENKSRERGNVRTRETDGTQRASSLDRPQQHPSQQTHPKDAIRRGGPSGGRDRPGYDPKATDEYADSRRGREEHDDRWGSNRGRHRPGTMSGGSGGFGQQLRNDRGPPGRGISTNARDNPNARDTPNARDSRGPPPGRNERVPPPSRETRWSRDDRRVDRREGGESGGGSRGQSREDGRRH